MRLHQNEIEQIRDTILDEFGTNEIYIFGSQLDSSRRGGDIDIFIVPKDRANLLTKESRVKFILEERLLKPIDILIHIDFSREIEQEALKGVKIEGK